MKRLTTTDYLSAAPQTVKRRLAGEIAKLVDPASRLCVAEIEASIRLEQLRRSRSRTLFAAASIACDSRSTLAIARQLDAQAERRKHRRFTEKEKSSLRSAEIRADVARQMAVKR